MLNISMARKLLSTEGPKEQQYGQMYEWIDELYQNIKDGLIKEENWLNILETIRPSFTKESHNGNGEVMDRIYTRYTSPDRQLKAWDHFWQNHKAAEALRKRKDYFIRHLEEKQKTRKELHVLVVAGGSCRCVKEFYDRNPGSQVNFTCLDKDSSELELARRTTAASGARITFINEDPFYYKKDCGYDIIWSPWMFDFLSNTLYKKLLSSLLRHLNPGGECLIANFLTLHDSQAFMYLLNWECQKRSYYALQLLGNEISKEWDNISSTICREQRNMFLHLVSEGIKS